MADKKKKLDYDLAFTHLQNHQNISAHNLFIELAEKHKKIDAIKAGLLYVLAGECKSRQNKDNREESLQAGKLFLNFAKNENNYEGKNAYLCAAKCFLKSGKFDDAKKAFQASKKLQFSITEVVRPVVIVDDSKSMLIKLQNHLKKLGYDNVLTFETGKEAIKECQKLIKSSQNPIYLLDMGLPDVDGDVIAEKILEEKPESQIILITADDKSSKRVNKTISSGVTAFIQKPFTINDLKDALNTAESEYSAL
jgi:CheY-like chemotaxis protein